MRHNNPIILILLSIFFFLACDFIIFRTGFYEHVISPASTAGKLAYILKFENTRPATDKKDILLTGDSRMEWGFSALATKTNHPDSQLIFVQASVPGSTLSSWYYALNLLDPHKNRYAAIVIPIAGYKIAAEHKDLENHLDTAQSLSPYLGPSEWYDLLNTYSDENIRSKAAMFALFAGHAQASDVQDLVLHPTKRYKKVTERNGIGLRWNEAGTPTEDSIENLVYDADLQKITSYPAHYTTFKRTEADQRYAASSPEETSRLTDRHARYMDFWLKRIVNQYKASSTLLVFVPMPSDPIKVPAITPLATAPDILDMIPANENVVILSAEKFKDIEQPKYFYDVLHLNKEGKTLFTEQLSAALDAILAKKVSDLPQSQPSSSTASPAP